VQWFLEIDNVNSLRLFNERIHKYLDLNQRPPRQTPPEPPAITLPAVMP
jgi:hypothetical protein